MTRRPYDIHIARRGQSDVEVRPYIRVLATSPVRAMERGRDAVRNHGRSALYDLTKMEARVVTLPIL